MQTTNSDAPELHHGDAWLYSCDLIFYNSDEFATTYQKVVVCPKRQPHSWVDCPFAHIGEKAKRRDLRFFTYTPELCQDAKRNVECPRGDACGKSHHVFESWLHPQLYRTRMCAAGIRCMRPVCFFAHTREQLRQPSKPSAGQAAAQLVAAAAVATAAGGAAVAGASATASPAALVLSPQPVQQLALPSATISSLAALALSSAAPDAAASRRAASPGRSAVLQHVAATHTAGAELHKQRRSAGQMLVRPPSQRLGSSGASSSRSPALGQRSSPSPAAGAAAAAAPASAAVGGIGAGFDRLGFNGSAAPSPQQLGTVLHTAWPVPAGDALQLHAAAFGAVLPTSGGAAAESAAGAARAGGTVSQTQLLLLQQQQQQQQMQLMQLMSQQGYPEAAAGPAPAGPQLVAIPICSGMEAAAPYYTAHPLAAAQLTPAADVATAAAAAARTAPAGVLMHNGSSGVPAEEQLRIQQFMQAAAAAAAAQQLRMQQGAEPGTQQSMAEAYMQGRIAAAQQQQQMMQHQQQQEAWHGLLQADMQDLVPTGLPASAPGYAMPQQPHPGYAAAATAAGLAGFRPVAQLNTVAEAELAAAQQRQQLLLMAAAAQDPAAAAALVALATGESESARAAALHMQQYGCSQQ
uniref:C3H1-type domain-containing protein n=1 Tax=Tetradesmus obliquus TaxID=3088 RepID=A0A383W9W2_TETOB|eukprot:jgi/Sobl393_1/16723/SZX74425.1